MIKHKIVYALLICMTAGLFSCKEKTEKELRMDEITSFEEQVMADNPGDIYSANKEDLDSLLLLYDGFIRDYPKDSISADLLFRSAGIYTVGQKISQAIICYQRIDKDYAAFSFHPYAIFNEAVLLETEFGQLEKAKEKYEKYIELYPEHEYAEAVSENLTIMGKSADEVLREIQSKADSNQQL